MPPTVPAAPPRLVQREMFRGDAKAFDFTIKKRVGGGVQNITGWIFWLTAKRDIGDADDAAAIALTSSPGAGITITDPANGVGMFTIPPEATEGFPDREVVLTYDIQAMDTSGAPVTLERGELHVFPDVTRRRTLP